MKPLILIRFRYLLWGWKKMLFGETGKKRSPALVILLGFLLLYVGLVWIGMMLYVFFSLSPLIQMGAGSLYFTMAFLLGSTVTVFGSVYTTQNQLYHATDNELLLAMPVTMKQICLSRTFALLCVSAFYMAFVTLPALGIYIYFSGFSLPVLLGFMGVFICVTLICQTVSCLLGWGMHQILARIKNKAVGSLLFMILFLLLYFRVYSSMMQSLITDGSDISQIILSFSVLVQNWGIGPMQLGLACGYSILSFLLVLLVTAAVCCGGMVFLFATYRHALLHNPKHSSLVRRKTVSRTSGPVMAVCRKEFRRFFTSAVYLTNMGVGVVLLVLAGAAGVVFREDVSAMISVIPMDMLPLILMGIFSFLLSTAPLSAPSISLEGKNLWILAVLPLDGKTILMGKLVFHILTVLPVSALVLVVMGITYGLSPLSLLCCLFFVLSMGILTGVLGLLCNLRFPRFDWMNEVYPVKQSVSTMLGMFLPMSIGIMTAGVSLLLTAAGYPMIGLILAALLPGMLCALFLTVLFRWGVRQMEALLAGDT